MHRPPHPRAQQEAVPPGTPGAPRSQRQQAHPRVGGEPRPPWLGRLLQRLGPIDPPVTDSNRFSSGTRKIAIAERDQRQNTPPQCVAGTLNAYPITNAAAVCQRQRQRKTRAPSGTSSRRSRARRPRRTPVGPARSARRDRSQVQADHGDPVSRHHDHHQLEHPERDQLGGSRRFQKQRPPAPSARQSAKKGDPRVDEAPRSPRLEDAAPAAEAGSPRPPAQFRSCSAGSRA